MRVVYWQRLQLARQQVIEALEAVPGTDLVVVDTLADMLGALNGAEALVLYDAPPDEARQVTAALSAPGNTVRWMHILTAGREGFDAVGLPSNVTVTAAAGCVAPTVAEHVMTLLLSLMRRVPAMLEEQGKRNWSRLGVSAKARSVEGMTMAIVGYGQIGREVAKRAKAFGIHIVAVSRSAKDDEFIDEAFALDALDTVLARADIAVLSIALTPDTAHLFDAARLAACKPGMVLVNVARGGVVVQTALARALKSGQIGGAGLDATTPEPLPADDPLWAAPNLIISPHFAGGGSIASQRRLGQSAAGNLRRLIKGEPLKDIVT